MKRLATHDCAACTDLRARLGDLARRLVALGQTPPRPEVAPAWPELPRRRVRVDAAHAPRAPHPLLLTLFVPARGGAAYQQLVNEEAAARPQVLDRVA